MLDIVNIALTGNIRNINKAKTRTQLHKYILKNKRKVSKIFVHKEYTWS